MKARRQGVRAATPTLTGLAAVAMLVLFDLSARAQTGGAKPAATAAAREFAIGALAVVYIPASVSPDKPSPLLVVLHGGGRKPYSMIDIFKPYAERHGMVLLAPVSKGPTWDMIHRRPNGMSGTDLVWRVRARMKEDPPRILKAVQKAGTYVAIDWKRSALIGISDGASYALSFGPDHPELFPTIVAYMPGMAVPEPAYKGEQRVFVAHGRQDKMLPFDYTAETIVPQLRQAGMKVTFHPYDGGHSRPPDAVTASGISFILENGTEFESD